MIKYLYNLFRRKQQSRPEQKPDLFFLDLNKNSLYGFEAAKSEIVIEAICNGIDQGDVFPPVPVAKLDDHRYALTSMRRPGRLRADGGHNRAIGHYIMNEPLLCELVDAKHIPKKPLLPIENITVRLDAGDAYLRLGDSYEFPNYCWPDAFLDELEQKRKEREQE